MSSSGDKTVGVAEKIYAITLAPYTVVIAVINLLDRTNFIFLNNVYLLLVGVSVVQMIFGTEIIRAMSKYQTKGIVIGAGSFVTLLPIFLFNIGGYLLLPEYYHITTYILIILFMIPVIVLLYESIRFSTGILRKSSLSDKFKSFLQNSESLFIVILVLFIFLTVLVSLTPILIDSELLLIVAFSTSLTTLVITLIQSFYSKKSKEIAALEETMLEAIRFSEKKDILKDTSEYWTYIDEKISISKQLPMDLRIGIALLDSYPNPIYVTNLANLVDLATPVVSRLLLIIGDKIKSTEEGLVLTITGLSWIKESVALIGRKKTTEMVDDLIIDHLYFNYIDSKRDFHKLRSGSTSEFASLELTDIYKQYFLEVFDRPLSTRCYPLFELGEKSEDIEGILQHLKSVELPDATLDFDTKSKELAHRFNSLAKPGLTGVLFVGRFTYRTSKYIGIFLFDWVSESYLTFNEDEGTLVLDEVLERLPARGRIRKGAIFPYPDSNVDAFVKVFQSDSDSRFFNQFLGGSPPLTTYTLMREIRKIATKLSSNPLTYEESVALYSSLTQTLSKDIRVIDNSIVQKILSEALPNISRKRIAKVTDETLSVSGLVEILDFDKLGLDIVFKSGIYLRGTYRDISEHFKQSSEYPNRHVVSDEIKKVRMKRS